MSDEATTTQAAGGNEQHTHAQAVTEAPTQPQAETEATTQQQAETETAEKTFTQEQFESALKERLKREETSLERKLKTQIEEQFKPQLQELEAKNAELSRKLALAGKVDDLDYAYFKLEQSGEADKYIKDGQLDEEAFFEAFPKLRKTPDKKAGPAPTEAGGSTNFKTTNMNTLIRKAAGRT
jgi:hypothetical protein